MHRHFLSLIFLFVYFTFGAHIGYSQNNPVACGMRDEVLPASIRETLEKLPSMMSAADNQRTTAAQMRVCRLAIDIDSYTWRQSEYDSLTLIKTLHETISSCSAHFEEQTSIRLVISHVTIFKDPLTDPYKNASGAYDYYMALLHLPQPAVQFDKRIVLFTKPASDYAGWAPYGEKLSSATLNSIPIVMHELGHSFGSPHTHSCDWPGGPIDYCSTLEGGPCYDGSMEVRSRPASLMSYCDQVTNIHPLSQMVMEEHAEKNFKGMTSLPDAVLLPKQAIISKSLYVGWPASDQALSYEVTFAKSEDFQGAQTTETRINGISLQQLNTENRFYLRVRSKNLQGVSDWSNPMLVDISHSSLRSVSLHQPADQFIISGLQRIEFDPVDRATAYEVQVATGNDTKFNNYFGGTIRDTFYEFQPYFDIFHWRVRAIFGSTPGPWSESRLFSHNTSAGNGLTLPFDAFSETAPLGFPFSYKPPRLGTAVNIAVSERADMSDPSFQKTYRQNTNQFSDWISGLPASRQLYFRVQEINTDNEKLPLGLLVDYTMSFTTGTIKPDARINFLTRYQPDIFGKTHINPALSANHIWFRSPNNGYLQISTNDLSYQVHHRENTNGLIGISKVDASVHGDREGKISFFNDGINGSFRVIRLDDEKVNPQAQVEQFVSLRNFFGFSPEGNICWNSKQISQLRHHMLDNILFEADWNAYVTEVRVDGDMIRFVLNSTDQQANQVVTMRSDGTILHRHYSGQNHALQHQFRQIAVQSDGTMWVRQQTVDGSTSVVAIKDDSYRLFEAKNIIEPGQRITSIFVSAKDQVYVMASGSHTQVYRLEEPGTWKKFGPELPYSELGHQIWVDSLENIWLSTMYGLVFVRTGDPILSVPVEQNTVLTLYPNPTSERLYIEHSKAVKYPCRFELTDILGRRIGSYLVTQHQSEIDIHHLSPGIYFIQTQTGDRSFVGRFVKQ